MRWQDKLEIYKNRLTNQNADDMICRRIWKGLGIKGVYNKKRLGEVEYFLTGVIQYDTLEITRTIDLMVYCITKTGKEWPWTCETLEITKSEDVQERINPNDAKANIPLPLFLTRSKHDTEIGAWALFPKDRIGTFFTPPYHVIKGDPECDFVVQNLEAFIRQFGPYDNLFEVV